MDENIIENFIDITDTNKCYLFNKKIYENPIFKNVIDATYIIHLEGNGRLDHIYNQLDKYQPSKIVYILFNQGYKKCKKAGYINLPARDLIDAFLTIFKHAKEKNYDNILILEDDFIFANDIKDHSKNVSLFLDSKKNTIFHYYLGSVPYFLIPYDKYHYINHGLGAHSVIYSKKAREYTLRFNQKNIKDWDLFNHTHFKNKYLYYKPLCYQLFPDTENSKHWGSEYNLNFLANILRKVLKKLQLDKKPEPGYSILYIFGKIFFIVLLLLLIYIIINCVSMIKY
jgi:hypothetical protein